MGAVSGLTSPYAYSIQPKLVRDFRARDYGVVVINVKWYLRKTSDTLHDLQLHLFLPIHFHETNFSVCYRGVARRLLGFAYKHKGELIVPLQDFDTIIQGTMFIHITQIENQMHIKIIVP